jgi:cell division septum initiation protein DivIVA
MPPAFHPEVLSLTALKELSAQLIEDVQALERQFTEKFAQWCRRPSAEEAEMFGQSDDSIKRLTRRKNRAYNKLLRVQGLVSDRIVEEAQINADRIVQEFRESIADILRHKN